MTRQELPDLMHVPCPAAEEVDDLDEVLNESIAASIGSKKKAAAELENQGKRKRHRDDDAEDDL